ncbi:aspartate semialdehyde dehydrogenase [Cavenderia fasciculata]|uniref:Aspartate-semialdehyde dehydrogenase n=1 Tax=Cavenderia fasciculata TaxID=261658 RepID=F4Q046_CACFS|nr:aspartate semialdehyde dehydrogenase [Cavenderia fasciculata]EGG18960.1 aspartate semialdehyde dehydrogenase [Cavenderia fasciculata]|eukprot:XP_004357422.1 aspartate semialdehyde dehydrogenase [Cavenderia fasciculata]
MNNCTKIKVGVLGATGTVGQRFIQLLENHQHFKVAVLGASANSKDKIYKDAVHWLLATPIPSDIANMKVHACDDIEAFNDCLIIFSALDASVATNLEKTFRIKGKAVFSNAKSHRYDSDVPIVVSSVNSDHIRCVQDQKKMYQGGFIVTNPNCSTTGVVVALKPIVATFGIKEVIVFTMQSVSGAGYPGVPSLDILGNVIPYIGEEEEKIEIETKKILGELSSSDGEQPSSSLKFNDHPMFVSAHTNRVPVSEGHTICLSIKLGREATVEEVSNVLKGYHKLTPPENCKLLISEPPLHVIDYPQTPNRPQPKLDLERGRGLTVTVGRIRGGSYQGGGSFDIRLTLLVHNTVLGAAGSSIQNAETCFKFGYIQ